MGNPNLVPLPRTADLETLRRAIQLLSHRLGVGADVVVNSLTANIVTAITLNATNLNAPHELVGANHTVSGLTPGHVLKALTATTFGFGEFNSASLTLLAGENISALQVVYFQGGEAFVASSSTVALVNRIVGVAITAATTGNSITVQVGGVLADASWSWDTTKPVFLGASGLTQTVPTSGFVCQVATVKSATEIVIEIQPSTLLG